MQTAPLDSATVRPPWPRLALVLVAALVVGGLESFAQGLLPEAMQPLANSASGWTLVTVVLVYLSGATWRVAAPLAALVMVLLLAGYSVVSHWRGYWYDPTLWMVIGVVVGPFVGVATAWLRATELRAALATAALAGVGLGEASYGLLEISDTTGSAYWIVVGVAAVALLVAMLAFRVRTTLLRLGTVALTAVAAAAFYAVYLRF